MIVLEVPHRECERKVMSRGLLRISLVLISGAEGVTLRHGLEAGTGRDLAASITFARIVEVEVGPPGGGGNSGSGVLLNGEWVLTAAHLVNAAVAAEVTIRNAGTAYRVGAVHVNPGWQGNPATGLTQSADLVLLHLREPILATPTVSLWQGGQVGGDTPLIGMMAGFGRGGNGLLGAYLPADGLRAAFNVIDRHLTDGEGGFWVTDFDSGQIRHNSLNFATVDLRYFDLGEGTPTVSETVFSSDVNGSEAGFAGLPLAEDFFPGAGVIFPEGTTSRGDSGGPLFLYSEERARWELAGVTSFGVNPLYPAGFNRFDSRYGDLSFFADVSSQESWIKGVVIPEPTVVGFLVGALGLLWGRKRG